MILRAILLGYFSLFILGISDNIRGPLFPEIINEFSLSPSKASLFFAISSVISFFASYATQFSVSRLGRLKTLRFSLVLLMIGQLGIGLSQNFSQIIFASLFFGAGLGIMGVLENLLVIHGAGGKRREQLLSGLHSMYGLASFLGPLLVAMCYSISISWRGSFLICMCMTTLLFAFSFIGDKSIDENIEPMINADLGILHPKSHELYYSLILAFYVVAEIMISTRLAIFSRDVFNYSFEQAAYLTSVFFLLLFAGRFLFSFFDVKIKIETKLMISLTLSLILMIAGILYSPLFLALTGFAMAPFYPMMITGASRLFSGQMNSFTSLAVALSYLLIVAMHFLIGEISELWGIKIALGLGPIFIVISLVMLGIPSYKRRKEEIFG